MYPNLMAEMARARIQQKELAKDLGITEKTMSAKMRGEADFKLGEMRVIRNKLGKTMDYLFDTAQTA
jgi:DNA-binding XRE family transcriptional regulator